MSWFENRVQNWKTRLPGDVGARCFPWRDPGPPLKVLIPDPSDPSSYEPHTFADAIDATAFFDHRFQGRIEPGVVSFWALQREPDDATAAAQAEPVVIIGDGARPGIVYSFSFEDIDSAMKFLRKEFALGLDLGCAEVYYAMPLLIELVGNGQFRLPGGPEVSQRAPSVPARQVNGEDYAAGLERRAVRAGAVEHGTGLFSESAWGRYEPTQPDDAESPAVTGEAAEEATQPNDDPFAGVAADAPPVIADDLESPTAFEWPGADSSQPEEPALDRTEWTDEFEQWLAPVTPGSPGRQEAAEELYGPAATDKERQPADGRGIPDPLSREGVSRPILVQTKPGSPKQPRDKKQAKETSESSDVPVIFQRHASEERFTLTDRETEEVTTSGDAD